VTSAAHHGRTSLPDINSAEQAGAAAARLELIWTRWQATRGRPDFTDPVTAYAGNLPEDPVGRPRVVISADTTEALLLTEMISYLIASRPLDHPGADRRRRTDRYAGAEQVPGGALWPWNLTGPPPETAEAERPIMPRPVSTGAVTVVFSRRAVNGGCENE
jgi:hypothetical protein